MDKKKNIQDGQGNEGSPAEKTGFLQNILNSIFKSSNPDADKKRRLKAIAKSLSKTKYHSFYKAGSSEIMPNMAKLMYDIYKVISPAQIMFRGQQNPAVLKRHIINYVMSENQLNTIEQLDERNLVEMSKKIAIDKLEQQVEEKLSKFTEEFTDLRIAKAENLCKALSVFRDFCTFDFYAFLKKFYSGLQENEFSSAPDFQKINAEYVLENLKDFVTVAFVITDDTISWQEFFVMLKETQGSEFVNPNNWKKIVAKIKSIQLSQSLDMIIQLISKDPKYFTDVSYQYESIIEPFNDKFQSETRAVINRIANEQRDSKTSSISMQIFGTSSPQSLRYYTEEMNGILSKKDLAQLEYTEALNFLKTFLLDYLKKDIREFFDVVVIRGQWDSQLAAPISNAYQELLKASDAITEFDNSMAEEGPLGLKIKTLLPKTAHDAGAENIINRVVSDANEMARSYIISCTQNLITIGKTLKQLIEDYTRPKPVIVQNWKELEKYIETPLKEFSVNIYKKIYLFVNLMQQYISNN